LGLPWLGEKIGQLVASAFSHDDKAVLVAGCHALLGEKPLFLLSESLDRVIERLAAKQARFMSLLYCGGAGYNATAPATATVAAAGADAVCKDFNNGRCTRTSCRFKHLCAKCGLPSCSHLKQGEGGAKTGGAPPPASAAATGAAGAARTA
jgi:hypothetical protein